MYNVVTVFGQPQGIMILIMKKGPGENAQNFHKTLERQYIMVKQPALS